MTTAMRSLLATLVWVASCSSTAKRDDVSASNNAGADSVVLERTVCFGRCPAYRLSIASNGRVVFTPDSPPGAIERDSISPGAFASLIAQIARANFDSFPPVTRDDKVLCAMQATDHPGSTITVFRPAGAKSVNDYTGCHAHPEDKQSAARLVELRKLDELIDSTAQSARWVRPRNLR